MDYRYKNCYSVITFPRGLEETSRGAKGCCTCKQLKLAHTSETENWKNDITGIYIKKSDPSDVVEITMEDSSGNVIPNLGFEPSFPNEQNVLGFVYQWQQILNDHGAGCYTIKVNFTIAGVDGGYEYGLYELKPFTQESSKNTVMVRSFFNTFYQKLSVDFTDSDYTDSIRFLGFFGKRQPKTEIKNLIGVNRRVEKSTRENVNEYTLNTDPIDICITRQLVDFHLLNEDNCFVSDHNVYNHDYLLLDKNVELIESPAINYIKGSRLASVDATFGDKTLTDKNYYR